MEIGIVDFLLREEDTSCLEAAAKVGCTIVDWTIDRPEDAAQTLADESRLGALLERMRVSGVRIRALYATCYGRLSLTTDDGVARTKAVDGLRQIALLANSLGVGTIVVPLFGESEIAIVDELPRLQRLLAAIVPIANAQRVRFAFKSILPAEAVLAVFAEFANESFGICLDPANCVPLGLDPVAETRTAAPALFHVHAKDRNQIGEAMDLGNGELNWHSIAETLRTIGYAGPVVLETPSGADALESAAKNAKFLANALQL